MQSIRKVFFKSAVCCTTLLTVCSCETIDTQGLLSALNSSSQGAPNIEAGLREALTVGIKNAVTKLSAEGGYSNNAKLKIPLPEKLQGVAKTLNSLGLGSVTDKFQTKMSEAAEEAAALAGPVFTDAITKMDFSDVQAVFKGGDTAATDYLKKMTSKKLKDVYAPIVRRKMQEVGAVAVYDDMLRRYNTLPLVKKINFNLEDYVADEALKGLFTVLADEEKKIRQDPAARTTELLKQVFALATTNS